MIIYNPMVACDYMIDKDEKCQNYVQGNPEGGNPRSKKDLRLLANNHGFLHIGHDDFCKDHVGAVLRKRFENGVGANG